MSTTVSTVTLDFIIGQARKRAKYDRSNFVVPDELYEFARGSIRELYDILVASFETWRMVTLDASTVVLDSSSQYQLPADFYKLKGVDYSCQTNVWTTLKPVPWNERNRWVSGLAGTSFGVLGYMLLGKQPFDDQVNYLQFLPEGVAPTTSYRVFYIPKPTIPVSGSDKVDGINGWEEYVIWDTVAYILDAASRDPSVALSRKAGMGNRIQEMATKRDAGQPGQQAMAEDNSAWLWMHS